MLEGKKRQEKLTFERIDKEKRIKLTLDPDVKLDEETSTNTVAFHYSQTRNPTNLFHFHTGEEQRC